MRIFLSDRDPGNLEAITLLLLDEGHTLVAHPLEAEILILDVNLPRDVISCEEIRSINKNASLFITTTLSTWRFSSLQIICEQVIYKPFDIRLVPE